MLLQEIAALVRKRSSVEGKDARWGFVNNALYGRFFH